MHRRANDTRRSGSGAGRPRRVRSRGRERGAVALLGLVLVASALAFGAQHTAILVVAALGTVAALLLAPPEPVPRVAKLTAGLALVNLVQLVPLPVGLLQYLSPAGVAIWRDALGLLRDTGRHWLPLSVDPSATALEALKWSAYACVLAAARGIVLRRSSATVAALVFGSSLVVAAVTLVHGLFDISKIYGVYVPLDGSRWLRGPFVNGNHLAGYLNLGLFAGTGLLLSRRAPALTWPLALGAPAIAAAVLLSNSRGGIACLVLGAILFAVLAVRLRVPDGRVRQVLLLGTGASLALTLVIGGSRLWTTLADHDVRMKTSVWRWSLDLVRDFAWFGAGRGSFETAFQPYRRLLGRDWGSVVAHAETLPLEWAAEWGVPLTLVALAMFALLFWRGPLRLARRDAVAAGLVAGLAALFVQNLVDFSLELFAVGALASAAFAGAHDSRDGSPTRRLRAVLPFAGLVAVAIVTVLACRAAPVQVDRRHLAAEARASLRGPASAVSALTAHVRRAVLAHPADSYPYLLGALIAERGHENPLPWLGQALARSPFDGQTHLALARALAARGARAQAVLHARYAAVDDVLLRDQALAEAARSIKTTRELVEAFPRGLPGDDLVGDLCRRLAGVLRVECSREARQRSRGPATSLALGNDLLDAWEASAPPCTPALAPSCASEVDALLGELRANQPNADWQVVVLRSRWLAQRGDLREAAKLLGAACPVSRLGSACWDRALAYAERSRDVRTVEGIAERYTASHCADAAGCAVSHERLAAVFAALGADGHALSQLNAAIREESTTERLLRSAELAVRAEAVHSARRALDQVTRSGALSEDQRRRADALEASLLTRDGVR